MTVADILTPPNAELAPSPATGPGDPVALDLKALEVHFQGYEISDPVTVALRPVTIATPPGASAMGRR